AAPGRIVAAAFAAAAAVLLALRVRQLIPQAALQPAAQPRQLRRVQAQLLLLRHLDRHRLERRQERRAAERTAAGAVAADHLRFVADADLTHLDARAELGGQLAHELPEVDAAFGREIEDQPLSVERLLGLRQLHAEAALADLERRDPVGVALALLVLQSHHDVVVRGDADHARRRFARRQLPLGRLRHAADDDADRRTAVALDDDLFAGARGGLRAGGRKIRVRTADGRELDRDEPRVRAQGPPLYIDGARASRLGPRLQLEYQPVSDDLGVGVLVQRRQGLVDRGERAHAAPAAERLREPIEIRPRAGVGEHAGVGGRSQHL